MRPEEQVGRLVRRARPHAGIRRNVRTVGAKGLRPGAVGVLEQRLLGALVPRVAVPYGLVNGFGWLFANVNPIARAATASHAAATARRRTAARSAARSARRAAGSNGSGTAPRPNRRDEHEEHRKREGECEMPHVGPAAHVRDHGQHGRAKQGDDPDGAVGRVVLVGDSV